MSDTCNTRWNMEDLTYQAVALPQEVQMYRFSGDFAGELAAIDRWLGRDLPVALRKRLELEHLFAAQLLDDYPLTEADMLKGLQESYPAATEQTLHDLIAMGNVDFILKNGQRHFQAQAICNACNIHTDYLKKVQDPAYIAPNRTKDSLETVHMMQQKGGCAYRYEVEEWFRLEPHAERPGEMLRIWFPYPVACATQPAEDIRLLGSSHPVTVTGTVHRTAFMEVPCEAGATYSVRFSFVNRATFTDLSHHTPAGIPAGEGLSPADFEKYTGEQYPHIRFTPFIRALAKEIRGDETDPLTLARRVYDWICAHVQYSYVRDYLLIENIPEFVLINGYGDCGTMALAFITLCRCLGIPAKWQSGSACYPDSIGFHDWCMFYVAPYGWLYCDPSYGVGAVRSGNETRRNYYFGNLDPYRMVASDEFQQPLTPDKAMSRMDPYDNQSGEAEYADGKHNIFFDDCTNGRRVLSSELLEE